jgi:thioredoxin 1
MNIVIYIIVAVAAFMLFLQWKTLAASKRMAGREAPAAVPRESHGVLYYFHHPRCGPCKSMGRVVSAVADSHPGRVHQVNIAEQPELARDFGVVATPTTLLVKDGRVAEVMVGIKSPRKLEALLD